MFYGRKVRLKVWNMNIPAFVATRHYLLLRDRIIIKIFRRSGLLSLKWPIFGSMLVPTARCLYFHLCLLHTWALILNVPTVFRDSEDMFLGS